MGGLLCKELSCDPTGEIKEDAESLQLAIQTLNKQMKGSEHQCKTSAAEAFRYHPNICYSNKKTNAYDITIVQETFIFLRCMVYFIFRDAAEAV